MFLLALLLIAQPAVTTARDTTTADTTKAESGGRDIIYYGGKRVIFLPKTAEVLLLDSAWVRYRDMSVHSDSIHYDVKRHELSAYADVLFTTGSENITGHLLRYDVDSHKGMMRTAFTHVQNGFFRADEIWLVHEQVLDARRACFTTCDRDPPHYVFYGPRVKLFMDDVAICEPMVFKLFDVPLLAVPFWMVPVGSKRKSGLMPFKIGNDQTEGLYAKDIAYYWVINDYSDMTFYADVMTKRGIQGRAEAVYIVTPFAQGNINGSYIREWDTHRLRYSVSALHRSDRFLFDTQLDGKLDLMSDASYIPDYSREELEWLKPDLFSYGQISKSLRHVGSVTVLAQQKTEYATHTRWADLPSVRLSVTPRPLFADWNLSPSASFLHHTQDYLDTTNTKVDSVFRDLDGNAGLGISGPAYSLGPLGEATVAEQLGVSEVRSYRNGSLLPEQPRSISSGLTANMDQRFLGTFSMTEGVGLTQSDNLSDTWPVSVRYTGSVSSRATLFRVYSLEAFGMHGLLHSVTPSAALNYEPKVDSGPLFGRPHFLKPSDANLSLDLANTFQAKVDTLHTKRDLGSVDFSSGYDMVTKHLSPLRGTALMQPLQGANLNLSINATAGFDFDSLNLSKDYSVATTFYLNRISTQRADTTGNQDPDDQWPVGFQLGFTHTYGRSGGTTVHMITATAALAIPGWELTVTDFGYNFAQKQFANYGLQLTKDLHCWEAFVKYEKLGTRWTYDFEVRIKQLPDLKVGKGTFGSILPQGSQ